MEKQKLVETLINKLEAGASIQIMTDMGADNTIAGLGAVDADIGGLVVFDDRVQRVETVAEAAQFLADAAADWAKCLGIMEDIPVVVI